MPQNLVEKIAQRYAAGLDSGHIVRAGDFLSIRPAHVLTHDNTGAVMPKFKEIGAAAFANPDQVVYALDHNVQDTSEANRAKYARIEAFAKEQGSHFHPAGRGIGHQIMVEEGFAWPGTMVVASDSHSNMYGGVAALGTPIVRTDAAAIWATGRTWWQVPPVARVTLTGKLRTGVTGKDVILTLCSVYGQDEVLNHAIEFTGPGVADLNIEQRMTIANMTTEWGALAGVFPVDEVLLQWLEQRLAFVGSSHPRITRARIDELKHDTVRADDDAVYAVDVTLDLASVSPWLSGPHNLKKARPVAEAAAEGMKIHKAYLLSCVNGRAGDLEQAAAVLRDNCVHEGVELYVSPASSQVQEQCEASGAWQVLVDSGAKILPPGCGPCIGLGVGLLEPGEVGISATNRNFKGRMGSPEAEAYLASPAVVAASAVAGRVALPEGAAGVVKPVSSIVIHPAGNEQGSEVSLLAGFPQVLEGELLLCDVDNLNTDGIYAGKWTYKDDMGPEDQASVAMENYDPDFRSIARKGDLLVGGFNFGTGSSREQAATALKYFGIALVLAGSFSETYKRNALNNGFLPLECPELVRDLRERFREKTLSRRTGIQVRLDFRRARLETADTAYKLAPVGAAAQELVLAGGLENWVKQELARG